MEQEFTQQAETEQQQEQQPQEAENSGMQELQEQGEQQAQQPQQQEDEATLNWRKLRQEKEEREREAQEYKRQLEEMRQQQQGQQQTQQQQASPDPNDIPTWGEVQKYMEQYQKQVSNVTAETKLKQQYPDFDQVVNQNTIAKLRDQYPELAQGIANTNDMYAQGKSAYTLVKKLGLSPEQQQYESSKQQVQQNASTPRPAQGGSGQNADTPLSHAHAFSNGLDEQTKKQLYKEMKEAQKRRS